MRKTIDITGQIFNFFTAVKRIENKKNTAYWIFRCVCGTEKNIAATRVKCGIVKSCGCHLYNMPHPNRKYATPKEASIHGLWNRYKQKAKIRKISWDLTVEQFKGIIFQKCRYCNVEPFQIYNVYKSLKGTYATGAKDWCNSAELKHVGVDRLDSSIGYTIENSTPCCKICNYAKNSLSVIDFYNWVQKIQENFKL